MTLCLQIVGNVELWLPVRCHTPTEIADSEVGQVSHAFQCLCPFVDGITVGDDYDITTVLPMVISKHV